MDRAFGAKVPDWRTTPDVQYAGGEPTVGSKMMFAILTGLHNISNNYCQIPYP
jgi:hypothetical protein